MEGNGKSFQFPDLPLLFQGSKARQAAKLAQLDINSNLEPTTPLSGLVSALEDAPYLADNVVDRVEAGETEGGVDELAGV